MHALAVITFALASVGAVVAQQPECDAQNILDACKDQYEPRLNACTGNDWECFCQEATNLLQCYNVCPKTDASGVQNQKVSYCNAWDAQKPTSSTSASSSKSTSSSSSSSDDSSSTSTPSSPDSPSGTNSAASSSSSAAGNAAGAVAMPAAKGVVAGILAIAAMIL